MTSGRAKLALIVFTLFILMVSFISSIRGTSGQKVPKDQVQYLVGVSQPNLIEPWRIVMNEEIKREVARHSDLRVIFTDAANDSKQQTDDVHKLMGYGIDLLIISLDDPILLTPTIAEVYAKIPVIVLGRGVTGYDYTLYIGTDNRLIGSKAGEYVKQLLGPSGGSIVEIQGVQGSPTVEERSLGFREALAGQDNLRLLHTVYADWQRDRAEDEMSAVLMRSPRIDLVFAQNDAMALGASRALQRSGLQDVKIIGVDGVNSENGGLPLVKNGILSGTFTSPTGGGEAIRYALDILNKEKGIPKKVILRSYRITPDNAAAFEQRLASYPAISSPFTEERHQLKIGFAQVGTESGWRLAHTNSVMAAAKEEGFELLYENADQSQAKQVEAIRKFIQARVDIIVFSPVVKTGWDQVLQEAKQAGIPVILSDREVKTEDDSLWTSYIGSDFVEEGRRAARWLLQELGSRGRKVQIVELQGTEGSDPAAGRKQGFEEVIGNDFNFQLIESLKGDFTLESGRALMSEALQRRDGDIQVVYAHNDDMALGAMQAIERFGLQPGKDIVIISIDATKTALKALATGKLNFVVECNPLLGPQLMKAVKDHKEGKELPMKIITSEGVFTQDSAKRELQSREY